MRLLRMIIGPLRRVAAVALLLGLGACTAPQGGIEAGPGSGGTGGFSITVGRVDALGSVGVAGVRFDDGATRVRMEIDPRAPQDVPLSALKLGMQARASSDGASLRTIDVAPEVTGRVEAVDFSAGTIRVAGQSVRIDSAAAEPTTLDSMLAANDIAVGQSLEVHGQRDSAGVIRASHLARRTPGSDVRITGRVSGLDAAARRFNIGQMTVIYTADVTLPAALADGQRVVVYGPQPASGLPLSAQVIRSAPAATGDASVGTTVVLSGTVTQLQGTRFVLAGVQVDASRVTLPAGPGSLTDGALARVTGTVAAGGQLQASAIALIDPATPPSVEITAAVTEYVDVRNFRLQGAVVNGADAIYRDLAAANLGNGVRLRVAGRLAGPRIVASSVNASPLPAGALQVYVGTVEQLDGAQGSFALSGLTLRFRLDPAVQFTVGTPGQFTNGRRVELRGRASTANEVVVSEVRIPDLDTERLLLSGVVGDYGPNPAAFVLNGITVLTDGATQVIGATNSRADLVDGRFVLVTARRVQGVILATSIDARAALGGVARVRGLVTDVAGLDNFRIAGQRIDGRSATFVPSALAGRFGGGLYIEAEGRMVDGVLQATGLRELQ